MSKPRQLTTSVRSIQFNRPAIAIVALTLMLGAVGIYFYYGIKQKQVSRKVMAVAQQLRSDGELDLAIRHLNQHLATRPNDFDAINLKAEIFADLAKAPEMIMPAAKAQDALIRLDPDSAEAQKARRRLVELYIRYGDMNRSISKTFIDDLHVTLNLRYAAAEKIATELIERGADDPEAHRLLALAREGRAVAGDREAHESAIREFRTVLEEDPKDLVAAEHLAGIYRDRMKDPSRAENVLDDLLIALPNSVDVRLIRHRHFLKLRKDEQAAAELAGAIALAPDNMKVILSATEDALRRGHPTEAKAFLSKVPKSEEGRLQVLMMRGMIDFAEEQPDEAVQSLRKCLMTSAGTDAETTWWLAYALTQLGRVAEAKPLVGQYRRLVGLESPLLHFLEALLDEKNGRPARAIHLIERIKERLDPQWDEMIQLARGRCYEALWDELKASEAYTLAIQTEPTNVVARLALANLRLKRHPEEAIIEVERGLALIPKDPALSVAYAGAILRREASRPKHERSFAKFDQAYRNAQLMAPEASALVLMQADRLALVGKESEALALLEAAAAKDLKNASIAVALSDGLNRLGKPERALAVIDRASDPKAAGDHASLRVARARALTSLFRGREARESLVRNIDKLSVDEQTQVWIALGQLEISRGDSDAARRAFLEWKSLVPDDPRPLLVLLELALEPYDPTTARMRVEELKKQGDETASRSRAQEVANLGGESDVAYRVARAKELIAEHDAANHASPTNDDPLQEANSLINAVLAEAPELPTAQMAHAQILERRGSLDEAAAAYERAWDNGMEAALPRIIDLLTRRGRYDALAKLRTSPQAEGSKTKLDLLSADAFVRVGDRTQAGKIAMQVAQDMPNSSTALGWQVRMLDHLGKIDDAESSLVAMAERSPGELLPWLSLLEFQAKHRREAAAATTVARIKAQVKTDLPELLDARIARARLDNAAAVRSFEAAIARKPTDIPLLLEAGDFYEKAERTTEAERIYRKVLTLDPNNRPSVRQLAVVLARRNTPSAWKQAWEVLGPEAKDAEPDDRLARAIVLGYSPDAVQREKAIPTLDDLLADLPANNPTAKAARKVLTERLLAVGKEQRAAQIAAVSAAEGSDPGAIALYAQSLIQSKNPAAAEWQLDRLSAISPGDLREASLRARLIWDRSRPLEAAAALERAYLVRENAPGADALGRETFILLTGMGNGSNDVAERVARALAKKNPARSWMVAVVLARKGLKDDAFALLKTATQPGASAEDLREVGRCAMQIAVGSEDKLTLQKAGDILTSALKIEPNSDELLVMTAMLRHLQRDYQEEVRLYKSVLVRRPESYVVLMNLAWALSEGLHTPSEAIPYLQTLEQVAGGDISVMDTRAVVHLRLGKVEDAIHELEAVVKSKPLPMHYFHLARAYKLAGRLPESKKSLEDARRVGLNMRELDIAEREDFRELVEPVKVGQTK